MKGIKSIGGLKAKATRQPFARVTRNAGLGMVAKGGGLAFGGGPRPFHEGEALTAGMGGNIASRPFPASPFSSGNPAKKSRSYVGP